MDRASRAFERTVIWIVVGAIFFVATGGVVRRPQTAWAQPRVPKLTEFPTGEFIPCDLGFSAEQFFKTVIVRTPVERVLVMVINAAARGQQTTVASSAFFGNPEEAIITVGLCILLCAESLRSAAVTELPSSQANQPFLLEVGNGASDVVAADFNNDDLDDLVFANSGSDTVSILLGAADLTFGPATTFPAGDRPAAIAVGDLNRNGNVDVVTANTGFPNENLTLIVGNGDGTLQASIPLADEEIPLDVELGDINGDAVDDIVLTAQNTGILTIISNGDGTFQPSTALDNSLFPVSVQLADMNADGIIDLLSSSAIRLGNGDGTLQVPLVFPSRLFHFFAAAGDINHDDVLDMAVVSVSANAHHHARGRRWHPAKPGSLCGGRWSTIY